MRRTIDILYELLENIEISISTSSSKEEEKAYSKVADILKTEIEKLDCNLVL